MQLVKVVVGIMIQAIIQFIVQTEIFKKVK